MKKYIPLQIFILGILFIYGFSHAGYRETFEREFMLSPWSIAKGETSACIQCHSAEDKGPEMHEIIKQWKASWHAKNNISCHDCHGGAPEDASMSMMHQRGFKGSPEKIEVPEFCGTCHIAIMNNYLKSGHGRTMCDAAEGPNCVTCHGSHTIQQASMDIINEELCSQCHTYERAQEMKQALFAVENKLSSIGNDLARLKILGVNVDESEKSFFRTHSEFRALFHSIEVDAVRKKSTDYTRKLEIIENDIEIAFKKLTQRKYFSAFIFLLFVCLSFTVFLLSKYYDQEQEN